MPRPIHALIDLPALRANLERARLAAAGRRVWAVVKANAYGHGIERAVRAFAAADGLALLDLAEAQRARATGWTRPILLLEGCFEPADFVDAQRLGLSCVVSCEEQLRMLELARLPGPIDCLLKLNTGMNRLGFRPSIAAQARDRLIAAPAARLVGSMTHFANADRPAGVSGPVSFEAQLAEYRQAVEGWREWQCVANSAALFLHPEAGGAAVRPGIALYGASPDTAVVTRDALGLAAGMHLRSELIAVQELHAGESVGYGSRYTAPHDLRLGVVACGYADGYPRGAADGTPVAVDGVEVPLVGRVSMDMLTVDLTRAPGARVGSAVELWGGRIDIDRVAAAAGTVGYELMCALAPRVPVREAQ
jgi:alanine racemase